MSTRDDWIKIPLSNSQDQLAHHIAEIRQERALRLRLAAKGFGSLETNLLGARGEVAFSAYRGVPLPDPDGSHVADKRRGYDVDGYQVRARSEARFGLNLSHADADTLFVLLLGHEAPTMYLVGWIHRQAGLRAGTWREWQGGAGKGDRKWCLVEQSQLAPFPETELYKRAPTAGPHVLAIQESDARFWCEGCGGTHPVREMRACDTVEA